MAESTYSSMIEVWQMEQTQKSVLIVELLLSFVLLEDKMWIMWIM